MNLVRVELENGETAEVAEGFAKRHKLSVVEDQEKPRERRAAAAASTKLVRAKLKDGSHATVSEGFAKSHGLTVLDDKPATNRRGEALAAKPATTVKKSAAGRRRRGSTATGRSRRGSSSNTESSVPAGTASNNASEENQS